MNNEDPKFLSDIFAKNKPQSKQKCQNNKNTRNATIHAEIANVLSKTKLLAQSVNEMEKCNLSDKDIIRQLINDLKEMENYCAQLVESTNKTMSYHMHLILNIQMEVNTLKKNQSFIDRNLSKNASPNESASNDQCNNTSPPDGGK